MFACKMEKKSRVHGQGLLCSCQSNIEKIHFVLLLSLERVWIKFRVWHSGKIEVFKKPDMVHFQPFELVYGAEHILHAGGVHVALTLALHNVDILNNHRSIHFHDIYLTECFVVICTICLVLKFFPSFLVDWSILCLSFNQLDISSFVMHHVGQLFPSHWIP